METYMNSRDLCVLADLRRLLDKACPNEDATWEKITSEIDRAWQSTNYAQL